MKAGLALWSSLGTNQSHQTHHTIEKNGFQVEDNWTWNLVCALSKWMKIFLNIIRQEFFYYCDNMNSD